MTDQNLFNKIDDSDLLLLAKRKSSQERNLTLEIIDILREIYQRRLHLKRGFSSLHSYCVEELKYSDGATFRRIKAMKLVEELPEAKALIANAEIKLSTASELQVALEARAKQKNPVPRFEKLELLAQLKGKSKRETQRVVAQLNPETLTNEEVVRHLSNNRVKIELTIKEELFKKIEELRAMTSHKNKSISDLLECLVNKELTKKNPELKSTSPEKLTKASPGIAPSSSNKLNQPSTMNSRYIPATIRRKVWLRDKGKCSFVDPFTRRACESRHRLQFEHKYSI